MGLARPAQLVQRAYVIGNYVLAEAVFLTYWARWEGRGTDRIIDRGEFYESFGAWLGTRVMDGWTGRLLHLPRLWPRLEKVLRI